MKAPKFFVAGIVLGLIVGMVLSTSFYNPPISVCPIVDSMKVEEHIAHAQILSNGTSVAKILVESYKEYNTPNYPLEIVRELYTYKVPASQFWGMSYEFKDNHMRYGRLTIRNRTETRDMDFTYVSLTPEQTQRIDGVGLVTSNWAVFFVSLVDFGGINNIKRIEVRFPEKWELDYSESSGRIEIGESNIIRVHFSKFRRRNYFTLVFSTNEHRITLDKNICILVVMSDGSDYRLSCFHSSSSST